MNDAQTSYQTLPAQQKPNAWLWPGLTGAAIGLVVGAAIASGIFWLVMREREQRLYARLTERLAERGIDASVDMWNTGITQAGNLLSGGSSGSKADALPTKEEMAAYLEGKPLPLPESDNVAYKTGDETKKSCLMTKDGVEAVQKGSSYTDPLVGIQNTGISFFYKSADALYAVEASVQHKPIQGETAFYGYYVTKVAKQ